MTAAHTPNIHFGSRTDVGCQRERNEDSLHIYKPNELCAVPGGRPKDGEAPVSTFKYVPEPEAPVEEEDPWLIEPTFRDEVVESEAPAEPKKSSRRRSRKPRNKSGEKTETHVEVKAEPKPEEKAEGREGRSSRSRRGGRNRNKSVKVEAKAHEAAASEKQPEAPKKENAQPKKEASVVHPVKEEGAAKRSNRRRYYHGKSKNKSGGALQT